MRVAPAVLVPESDRETLLKWSRGQAVEARLVERANVVLLAADGHQDFQIADELDITPAKARRWRGRYIERGLKGIEEDAPRTGRPRELSKELEAKIVTTTQNPPEHITHWSVRRLAKHLDVPQATVQRVWKRHDLKPHIVRTFKLSKDPHFVEKLEDVVGLYLDPPKRALVLSLDEKSQIQALDRSRPRLKVRPGLPEHQTHDYKRHGTTTLFAALELATGSVITKFKKRHRHQEFITFLREIDEKTPADLDLHVILDNYGTHKTPEVQRWIKKHPRFHLHFIPTSSSWLNLVERLFRNLTDQRIRRGTFTSVPQLEAAIQAWLDEYAKDPKPFKWTKTVDEILRKVAKYRRTFDTLH